MFYVYLLENNDGRRYVGFTGNLKKRLEEHNAGQSTATKPYVPWRLIFYEAYLDKYDALRRESYLKTTQGRHALRRMLKEYDESKSTSL